VHAFVDSITETSKLHAAKHPEFDELLATFFERSKAIRAGGGIGIAFVMVYVQDSDSSIMQISPFGLPELLDSLPYDREWLISLKKIVAMGKVI
jgi:hypothetical protein